MLSHIGPERSFKHNIKIAVMLCINAGFINAAGFMALGVLTTNVTGHAALLAIELAKNQWPPALNIFFWLLAFLTGAFSAGILIQLVGPDKPIAYKLAIIIIALILFAVAFFGKAYSHSSGQTALFAAVLLFSMGMQNALVTLITSSIVRTTHLTGMFTDLGLDLAFLIAPVNSEPHLLKRIALRSTIILFFLLGGVLGSVLFGHFSFAAFYIPVGILTFTFLIDYAQID